MDKHLQFHGLWGVILGGSGGFGYATVEKLSAHGMNLAVVYRENASTNRELKQQFAELAQKDGTQILSYNINALEAESQAAFINGFLKIAPLRSVKLLLHSISRGNLKPLVSGENEPVLSSGDIQYTAYAMSNSLLDWTRLLLNAELFHADGRITGLTSEGAHRYWESYAAVSIAKSSLESLAKYMAVEFSAYGLKTIIIQAGITVTASLKKIPGNELLIEENARRNPFGRMTKPDDVANVIYLLCTDEAFWINGALIHADGGEHCR
jgi:enoyl-[acyl-carrier-protein] reductase (NADH)